MSKAKRLFWLSDANTAHTRRWVKALSDEGYRVLVFSLAEPDSDWTTGLANVDLETAGHSTNLTYSNEGGWRKLTYVSSVRSVSKMARTFDPAICHAHYVSSYGILATLANIRPRVVSVWGADVYSAPERSWIHRAAIRFVLDRADKVLSTSHVMRKKTANLTKKPIAVVPFGIDTERFQPSDTEVGEGSDLVVGSIKSLESKYGMEFLIRAVAILKTERPDIPIVLNIYGAGSLLSSLVSLADFLSVSSITNFPGRVDYDVVHLCHQSLDIAVYPSIEDSESFGVSVIESQACGKPVVVSRVGGLPEVVNEGVTGLVVPPKDAVALAEAILKLAEDRDCRLSFGEAGRKRVERHYSLEKCVSLLVQHYQQCMGAAE